MGTIFGIGGFGFGFFALALALGAGGMATTGGSPPSATSLVGTIGGGATIDPGGVAVATGGM